MPNRKRTGRQRLGGPHEKREWTIMVYMGADNDLTDDCVFALKDMRTVATNKKAWIVAQFDPQDEYLPSQRYEIGKSKASSGLEGDLVDFSYNGYFKLRSKTNKRVRSMTRI